MKKPILLWIITAIAVAGALVGAYFLGRAQADSIDENLMAELEKLRAGESDAAVVKRVSQQMENIAYQQKAVSDQQRDRAEEQSVLALAMRDRAEQESRLAREAEIKANEAANEAEEQRAMALSHQAEAEIQRDQANYAKSVTDTLNYRTLGRTLANSSLTQFESGSKDLAVQLAYVSWYFLKNYGGNTYQPETFEALSTCTDTKAIITVLKGGAVTSLFPLDEVGCLAVTDYGEIEIHRRVGARRTVILQDNSFNFRDVWVDKTEDTTLIYALSLHGPLCKVNLKSNVEKIQLPYDTYIKLMSLDDNHLGIAGQNNLVLVDKVNGTVVNSIHLDRKLTTMAMSEKDAFIFYEDGTASILDRSTNTLKEAKGVSGHVVTAAYYDNRMKALFLGCDNGDIHLINRYGKDIMTIFGHISRISDMTTVGNILVSASYDKKAYIWNMPLLKPDGNTPLNELLDIPASSFYDDAVLSANEWLTPAYKSYDNWVLSLCQFTDTEVAIGTADGKVQRINVSTDDMAAKMKQSGNIQMSAQDWTRYVGVSVPYLNF